MTSIDVLRTRPPFSLRPYTAYTYAYPHKTAYRPLTRLRPLEEVWAQEDKSQLFLYVHIPFCEVRCGFCNLFTIARAGGELSSDYLAALQRQIRAIKRALPAARFVRLAIGGGTPTYLHRHELQQLLEMLQRELAVDFGQIPFSCEASPATIDRDKLRLLADYGGDRLSLGIQSFDEAEAKAMGRPQNNYDVARALELLDEIKFPIRNLDLIYGAENQTPRNFVDSVRRVIEYGAEEVFLYPLYVRQLTGLGKRQARATESDEDEDWSNPSMQLAGELVWDNQRQACYQSARDILVEAGYTQHSMRNFSKVRGNETSLDYCCQIDGMLGLGCGARSYTRSLHYSGEYAVGVTAIKGILLSYMQRTEEEFGQVNYGFELNEDEQRRRFLLMSLLQATGLQRAHYRQRFGTEALDDYPQLLQLEASCLATLEPDRVVLTREGLALSDAIGPWLYSAQVQQLSEEYRWQ